VLDVTEEARRDGQAPESGAEVANQAELESEAPDAVEARDEVALDGLEVRG
jgi:hypothetical protein